MPLSAMRDRAGQQKGGFLGIWLIVHARCDAPEQPSEPGSIKYGHNRKKQKRERERERFDLESLEFNFDFFLKEWPMDSNCAFSDIRWSQWPGRK